MDQAGVICYGSQGLSCHSYLLGLCGPPTLQAELGLLHYMIVELVLDIFGIAHVVVSAGLGDIRGACVTILIFPGATRCPSEEQLRHLDWEQLDWSSEHREQP